MTNRTLLPPYITLGLAIFSMFFGAGNVIYPMDLGVTAGASTDAWLGFILTAIGAPLLGLYAVLLAKGNLFKVFESAGIKGASLWIMILICALGPIGATPRCVILSYQALHAVIPTIPLGLYSALLGLSLLLICLKRFAAFGLLGKYLSPTLLCLLIGIALVSFTTITPPIEYRGDLFSGVASGYQTMDLLASLLFGVTIWQTVKQSNIRPGKANKTYVYAAMIGAALLAVVYLCLGIAASKHAHTLTPLSKELYLNALAMATLGSIGSKIACLVIFLACVTTIVALIITCTDSALQVANKSQGKFNFSYTYGITTMLLLTMLTANLGFDKVSHAISIIVTVTYPVYIMVALCYILNKKFNFQWVNVLVYGSLVAALGFKFFPFLTTILPSA